MKTIPFLLLSTAIVGWASQARAVSVDVELAFLLDSSDSIGLTLFEQQRDAYANLFSNNFFNQFVAPLNGATVNGQPGTGRIAVSFWTFGSNAAGTTASINQVIPWTEIASQGNADTVASQISGFSFVGGVSPLGGAIQTAATSIFNNTFTSLQSIIDVGTDANDAPPSDTLIDPLDASDFARCGGPQTPANAACYADPSIVAPNGVSVLNTISLQNPAPNIPLLEDITYGVNLSGSAGTEFFAADISAYQSTLANKLSAELTPTSPGQVPEPSLAFSLIGMGMFGIGKKYLSRRR